MFQKYILISKEQEILKSLIPCVSLTGIYVNTDVHSSRIIHKLIKFI